MSPRITHSKVSGKPNPTDASKVGGEDWDADHVIDGLTIGTDVQAHDTTLDALAAFDSNGILVQYGTDQFTARTLTGTANEITVANGAGASGNPTISLPSALTFTGKTVTGGTFNDILSMTAHTAGATASTVAATARLAKFYDGSIGTPVTSIAPSFSISRYDTSYITAGVYPSALFVETVGQNTSSAHGVSPLNAATFSATQNGDGDVLGVGVEVTGNGGNSYYAYGYFYNVWAKVAAQASFGIEGVITNDSASAPYSAGATNVYFAHLNLGASGAYNTTAGIHLWQGTWSRKHDVGLLGGINSVASALVWDDTSAVTSYKDTGTHTDGIDLTGATYSGSPFKSTGFTLSNIGGITADTVLVKSILALDHANADVELGSTSASGTPFIDFHSSGNNIDYDARIIASGGTGVAGNGTLTVTAATFALPGVTTIGGVQAVSISAAQTLTNKSMDGGSNTFTNIPIGSAISGLGTGVATALGINVGTAGAPVINGGALGSPSSVGTMPAFTLGGAITGGSQNVSGLGTLGATDITASGFVQAAGASGVKLDAYVVLDIGNTNYVRMKDLDGIQFFSVGNVASGFNYAFFDRDESWFRSKNISTTYAKFQSNGLNILTTTASTSTTTGALTVAGGVGIAGDMWTGGYINAGSHLVTLSTTASTSPTTGALRSGGGAGIVGDVNAGGKIVSQTGIGYPTGAGIGGTVTQATSKSTGVTLSKPTGQITMNGAALNDGTVVSFTLTNTFIAETDVLVLNHLSGGTIGAYTINAQCGAGSATINIRNNTGGSLSEALVLQFALIKGATN